MRLKSKSILPSLGSNHCNKKMYLCFVSQTRTTAVTGTVAYIGEVDISKLQCNRDEVNNHKYGGAEPTLNFMKLSCQVYAKLQ